MGKISCGWTWLTFLGILTEGNERKGDADQFKLTRLAFVVALARSFPRIPEMKSQEAAH